MERGKREKYGEGGKKDKEKRRRRETHSKLLRCASTSKKTFKNNLLDLFKYPNFTWMNTYLYRRVTWMNNNGIKVS